MRRVYVVRGGFYTIYGLEAVALPVAEKNEII